LEVRDAPAPQAEDAAGLGALGDDEVLGAVERLELEVGAEGGLGDRQVQLVDEVEALPLEAGVAAHLDVHVEVAVTAAPDAGRAPTGQAQRGPGVDAGGDVDVVRLLDDPAPLAAAGRAGPLDDLAEPGAPGALAGGDDLAEQRLADPAHLARATAGGARRR